MENISASKSFEPWNKNKLVGAKSTAQVKRNLGNTHSSRVVKAHTRPCFIQPCNRLQTSSM